MRTLVALAALFSLLPAPAYAQTTTDFQSLARLFDYDAKQPLDVHDKIIEEFPDGAPDYPQKITKDAKTEREATERKDSPPGKGSFPNNSPLPLLPPV